MDDFAKRDITIKRKRIIIGSTLSAFFVVILAIYYVFFSAPVLRASSDRFVIKSNVSASDLGAQLKSEGYIRNFSVFEYLLNKNASDSISAGTYDISKAMNVWQIVSIFKNSPNEVWVLIPPGLRKEEIANILASSLSWSDNQKKQFLDATDTPSDDFEGVYFPDTYLIPRTDSPESVAKRLRSKFQENLAPYTKDIVAQNMKWTTVVKVASLVQREAAGKSDMPIIAGIIWNRLEKNMRLQIDATVQYARGDTGAGYWAPLSHNDLSIDSPYNTYLYAGLPPYPIANPGIDAIKAAIYPKQTSCLYYLHDSSRQIHCASTLAEQDANIAKYLK